MFGLNSAAVLFFHDGFNDAVSSHDHPTLLLLLLLLVFVDQNEAEMFVFQT